MAAQPTYQQPAAQPVQQQVAPEKVTFLCARFPNLKMVVKTGEQRFVWEEGRQVVLTEPDRFLSFRSGMFETTDPTEIAFIRSHSNFTGLNKAGQPDRQIIKEMAKIDPNQAKAMLYLQQMGAAQIVQAVEKTHGIQPGYQVQDPVAATAQHHYQQQQLAYQQQQGYQQNAYPNQAPRQ